MHVYDASGSPEVSCHRVSSFLEGRQLSNILDYHARLERHIMSIIRVNMVKELSLEP
jgi:hypothetical protein